MNTAEILVREMQRWGGFQMRKFLTKSKREPREPAHLLAHGQVLSFDKVVEV